MEDGTFLLPSSLFKNYPSAKIKVDQLFQEWIKNEGSTAICTLLLDSLSLNSTDFDSLSISTSPFLQKALSDRSGGHSPSSGLPRSSMKGKSPKKRTQSEMLSNSNNSNAGAGGAGVSGTGSGVGGSSTTTGGTAGATNSNTSSNSNNSINNNSSTRSPSAPGQSPESSSGRLSAANTGSLDGSGGSSSDDNDIESTDHTVLKRRPNFDKIPVFYVPGKKKSLTSGIGAAGVSAGVVSEDDQLSKRLPEIESFFKPFPNGIPVEKFVHVTKRLCGIPSFFNLPLCRRINERFGDADSGIPAPRTIGKAGRHPSGVKIKLKVFLKFWQAEVEPFDRIERFFRIIKKHDAQYIFKDDFVPFLQELLHFHPGLDFLEEHEEFQRKYALTVITRIFYVVNTSRSGKLSLREVRRSNLFNACMHVDEETDINRVVDYFSYEHFYVLYCRFFELDADKDSKLTRNDLLRYGEHSLSEAIVDRIFQVGTRVFSDGQVGNFSTTGMSYPDFIFFMLSEEDKSNEMALRYWFSCCDLDGDRRLSPEEMRHFYRHQVLRVTSLGQESIQFADVLCQMVDMINPKNPHAITIEDMTKPDKRMISGVLFDILFNLHKFMRFESRDPFQEKIRREDTMHSDWDRFAHVEYNRLAQEEEEGYDMSMEVDPQEVEQQYKQMGMEPINNSNINNSAGTGGGGGGASGDTAGWSLNDDDDDDDDDDDNTDTGGGRGGREAQAKQWGNVQQGRGAKR